MFDYLSSDLNLTYCTLTSLKEELNVSVSNTNMDGELNDLLTTLDNYINTRLQRYTSLPLQNELLGYLSDLEARWATSRFRMRRATPQEVQQYQAILNQIELEFQEFLKANFRTTFSWASPSVDECNF